MDAVPKWIADVRHYNPSAPIIVVGNKTDQKQALVRFELTPEVKRVTDSLQLPIVYTSAKRNNNVDQVFKSIVTAYIQEIVTAIPKPLPSEAPPIHLPPPDLQSQSCCNI